MGKRNMDEDGDSEFAFRGISLKIIAAGSFLPLCRGGPASLSLAEEKVASDTVMMYNNFTQNLYCAQYSHL